MNDKKKKVQLFVQGRYMEDKRTMGQVDHYNYLTVTGLDGFAAIRAIIVIGFMLSTLNIGRTQKKHHDPDSHKRNAFVAPLVAVGYNER